MDDRRFDDLTRSLSNSASRRQLLKGLVGGAIGFVGAALGRGQVQAAPDQKRCAVYCNQLFGKGPAFRACRKACAECDADISRICFGPTGATCCEPGASCCVDETGREFCCPVETECCGSTCCAGDESCCFGAGGPQCVACPEGQFPDPQSCECVPFVECTDCGANPCGVDPLAICGENPETGFCLCAQTIAGGCDCVQPICGVGPECSPDAPDCPEGFVCITADCCGISFCAAQCDTSLGGGAATAARWG
jgi:hypothetical protein